MQVKWGLVKVLAQCALIREVCGIFEVKFYVNVARQNTSIFGQTLF